MVQKSCTVSWDVKNPMNTGISPTSTGWPDFWTIPPVCSFPGGYPSLTPPRKNINLGGGFKYFLFSPLLGVMIPFDYYFSISNFVPFVLREDSKHFIDLSRTFDTRSAQQDEYLGFLGRCRDHGPMMLLHDITPTCTPQKWRLEAQTLLGLI